MAVTKVVMPKLSEAMETGKVIKWLKKEGDRIQGGDVLAEVETDKADVEMEAFGSGVLRKVLVGAGDRVPVGVLIAVIAEPDDDIATVLTEAPPPSAPAEAPPKPAAMVSDRPAVSPQARSEDFTTRERSPAAPAAPTPAAPGPVALEPAEAPAGAGGRVKASPLARKIASQSGVDLRVVQGSGPGGRIVRRDVEAMAAAPDSRPAAAPARPAVARTGAEW